MAQILLPECSLSPFYYGDGGSWWRRRGAAGVGKADVGKAVELALLQLGHQRWHGVKVGGIVRLGLNKVLQCVKRLQSVSPIWVGFMPFASCGRPTEN